MLSLFYIASVLLLSLIAWQDLKQRAISWIPLPLLLGTGIAAGLMEQNRYVLLQHFLINLGFIIVQLLCVTLYFSVKEKTIVNITRRHLGWGDVLFFAALCVFFSPVNFILFYLASLILTLLGSLLYMAITRKTTQAIPLAGGIALTLIILILCKFVSPAINFYNDTYWISILT